jgi:hypothetical protein
MFSSDTADRAFQYIHWVKWVVTGAIGLAATLKLALRRRRSESWPMLPARVERAEVHNEDTGYSVTLDYSYQVNGEFFSGFYEKRFKWRRFAEEFETMNRGQQLFVRYDPEKPEISVLRDKDNAALLVLR